MTTTTATAVAAPGRLGRAANLLREVGLVFAREISPELRVPIGLIIGMLQPLIFIVLFGPLLGGMPGLGDSHWQWFVPGIVAMTALMGASFTGANLTQEIVTGSHERLLVSPLSRSSMLVGRALKEIVPMLMVAVIWYLFITSILNVGQGYIERYYARGVRRSAPAAPAPVAADPTFAGAEPSR